MNHGVSSGASCSAVNSKQRGYRKCATRTARAIRRSNPYGSSRAAPQRWCPAWMRRLIPQASEGHPSSRPVPDRAAPFLLAGGLVHLYARPSRPPRPRRSRWPRDGSSGRPARGRLAMPEAPRGLVRARPSQPWFRRPAGAAATNRSRGSSGHPRRPNTRIVGTRCHPCAPVYGRRAAPSGRRSDQSSSIAASTSVVRSSAGPAALCSGIAIRPVARAASEATMKCGSRLTPSARMV